MNNQEKGNLLEDVVESIERFLLSENPGIKYHDLTIQRKKRLTVDEVLHEIDLFVQIDMGNGYEATYIFECKNWKDNVDKNEIIIFSEKIKATNAAKGFFIAKGFSSYAYAQAKRDARIELVIATEELNIFPYATVANSFDQKTEHVDILLFEPGSFMSLVIETIDDNVFLNGKKINLIDLVNNEVSNFVARKYGNSDLPTKMKVVEGPDNPKSNGTLEPGTYFFDDRVSFHLPEEMKLEVAGILIGKIHTKIKHTINIVEPTVLWQYDVQTRGRVGYFKYDSPTVPFLIKMVGKEGGQHVFVEATTPGLNSGKES